MNDKDFDNLKIYNKEGEYLGLLDILSEYGVLILFNGKESHLKHITIEDSYIKVNGELVKFIRCKYKDSLVLLSINEISKVVHKVHVKRFE